MTLTSKFYRAGKQIDARKEQKQELYRCTAPVQQNILRKNTAIYQVLLQMRKTGVKVFNKIMQVEATNKDSFCCSIRSTRTKSQIGMKFEWIVRIQMQRLLIHSSRNLITDETRKKWNWQVVIKVSFKIHNVSINLSTVINNVWGNKMNQE